MNRKSAAIDTQVSELISLNNTHPKHMVRELTIHQKMIIIYQSFTTLV